MLCVCVPGIAQKKTTSPPPGFTPVFGFNEVEKTWTDTTAEVRISLNLPQNEENGRKREMNAFLHAMTLHRSVVVPLQGPAVYGEFVAE